VRVIAHDLNGPLTGMNLTLQACRKLASTDAMRQLLNALATDLTSATDLLEELKSLNRRDTFRMQKIDLVAEMKALIDQVQSNPRVPIFIDLVDSNEKLTIAGDISRLRRAWQNIIRNTIDTAEARKDGERVALQVSMKRSGASARIRFSDNGGGIDRRRVARVFEPFYTTKGEKNRGLGLFIARKIVIEHHGKIRVSSKKPMTRVTIDLPALP
jgi:signal transduction histidine kinase